jgi:hypothetical protein
LRLTAYRDVPASRGVMKENSSSTGSSTPRISGSVAAPASAACTGTARVNIAVSSRWNPAACALPTAIE